MGAWKTGVELAQGGLPQFLRELAAALEAGSAGGDFHGLPAAGFSVNGLRKLVLVAERTGAGLSVRLKAKGAGEGSLAAPAPEYTGGHTGGHTGAKDKDRAAAAREKYRQLKKAMQADFKALLKCAQEGRLPEAETLESFLSLAEMNQAQTAFLEDCRSLRRACAARDPAALAGALERLGRRKSACHAQFR